MSKKASPASSQPRNPSDTLVAKVWGFCNKLRDDRVRASEYLEQLTFLLFLKMSDELAEGQTQRVYHHGRCDIGSPWACGNAFDAQTEK